VLEDVMELDPAAEAIKVSYRTIRDPRWRARVGLPVVRVGRKILGVREADLRRVIRRGIRRDPQPGGRAA
jgi:hypothetical protein